MSGESAFPIMHLPQVSPMRTELARKEVIGPD